MVGHVAIPRLLVALDDLTEPSTSFPYPVITPYACLKHMQKHYQFRSLKSLKQVTKKEGGERGEGRKHPRKIKNSGVSDVQFLAF